MHYINKNFEIYCILFVNWRKIVLCEIFHINTPLIPYNIPIACFCDLTNFIWIKNEKNALFFCLFIFCKFLQNCNYNFLKNQLIPNFNT